MSTNTPKQDAFNDVKLALLNLEINPSHLLRLADAFASRLNDVYKTLKKGNELTPQHKQPARPGMSFRG